MGLRERVMGWLDRGEAPAEGDPDAPVEIANELLIHGPRIVALLSEAGIEAHAIDAPSDALHGSGLVRVRILVRRRDAQRATEFLNTARDSI